MEAVADRRTVLPPLLVVWWCCLVAVWLMSLLYELFASRLPKGVIPWHINIQETYINLFHGRFPF